MGEYLVYDVYNEVPNDGDTISYWDVGFLKVWDNDSNDFGDGTISKLFQSLPENISVGNPSFAKNSPYIIVFDYIDYNGGVVDVMGCNVETGDVGTIFSGLSNIGNPSYSKSDDKVTFTAKYPNYPYDYVAAVSNIQTDKISSIENASIVARNTRWPVYFATGVRDLTTTNENNTKSIDNLYRIYPNPLKDNITIEFNSEKTGNVDISIYNIFGQEIKNISNISTIGYNRYDLDLKELIPSTYILKISNGSKISTHKIIKTE